LYLFILPLPLVGDGEGEMIGKDMDDPEEYHISLRRSLFEFRRQNPEVS
jgi:hypothetical protein